MSFPKKIYQKLGILIASDVFGTRLISAGNRIVAILTPETLTALYPNHLGHLNYICNICGQHAGLNLSSLHREMVSCFTCGSSLRYRAIIQLLSKELFGVSTLLPDFPIKRDIRGIGMSDWEGYSDVLVHKFDYVNTFYDQDPTLDITEINPELEDSLDFLISSDVFEHVAPPISIAFRNAYRMLKPGGVFIFSAPYKKLGITEEFYPNLYKYDIVLVNDQQVLYNTTRDGRKEVFTDLTFHGGPGVTLAMRLFSELSLIREFYKAGFQTIRIANESYFEYGIYWNNYSDLPIVARK